MRRRSNHFQDEPTCSIYILTNFTNTTLYTGFSTRLKQRIWEHKQKLVKGFASKYNLTKLVYYEAGGDYDSTLAREKQIKAGSRTDKIKLIENLNPKWKDLYDDLD
ncbi:MAG: GIY-YIG nuclease family protein [Candidatus Doudnabacteria bacterium]|nr:GIY-YIG nuclease family protein [Candidatus Doudnabacteria bacterium]